MITLASYFQNHIVVINRAQRTDRLASVEAQAKKFHFPFMRFDAHDMADCLVDGKPNGNWACTSSHRSVLGLICAMQWQRTLVLEDDFQIDVGDAFEEMFDAQIREVPDDWDFLFLGGGYGEGPIEGENHFQRINGSVIRAGRMMTTSSYGITLAMARKIAPHLHGIGPIDSLYGGWQREAKTYVLTPRLMIQADGMSDLTGQYSRNHNSMRDTFHENLV